MPTKMSRAAYAGMFGPTTGDKVRLTGKPRKDGIRREIMEIPL